jgi:hypothetical protein
MPWDLHDLPIHFGRHKDSKRYLVSQRSLESQRLFVVLFADPTINFSLTLMSDEVWYPTMEMQRLVQNTKAPPSHRLLVFAVGLHARHIWTTFYCTRCIYFILLTAQDEFQPVYNIRILIKSIPCEFNHANAVGCKLQRSFRKSIRKIGPAIVGDTISLSISDTSAFIVLKFQQSSSQSKTGLAERGWLQGNLLVLYKRNRAI